MTIRRIWTYRSTGQHSLWQQRSCCKCIGTTGGMTHDTKVFQTQTVSKLLQVRDKPQWGWFHLANVGFGVLRNIYQWILSNGLSWCICRSNLETNSSYLKLINPEWLFNSSSNRIFHPETVYSYTLQEEDMKDHSPDDQWQSAEFQVPNVPKSKLNVHCPFHERQRLGFLVQLIGRKSFCHLSTKPGLLFWKLYHSW